MMKRKLYLLGILVASHAVLAQAQNFKTGVLVYGENNSALAAALQAAKSGVQTTVLLPHGKWFLTEIPQAHKINGMALCLLDTILKTDSLRRLPKGYNETLFNYLDTLKNLTIIKGIDIVNAERKGSGWRLLLNSKSNLKADEIVDASIEGKIARLAGAKIDTAAQYIRALGASVGVWKAAKAADFYRLRSNLATVCGRDGTYFMPFSAFLAHGVDHLILAGRMPAGTADSLSNAADFSVGQAAGAIAAYGSFFKDYTPKLYNAHIRVIQKELLDYHLSIFEAEDLALEDTNWMAVQQTLLCGFFLPKNPSRGFAFEPSMPVKVEEIKAVLQNIYFKATIWFEDHALADTLTVEQAIGLVCYLGNKGYKLSRARIEQNWDKSYGFGRFEAHHAITRVQFAVLVKDYLMSFPLKIDLFGKLRS